MMTLARVRPGAGSLAEVTPSRRKRLVPRAAANHQAPIGRGPPSSVWRTRTLSRVCPGPRGLASSATSGSTYTGSTRLIAGGAPSLTTRRRALRVGRSPAKEKPPSGPVMARATVAKLLDGYGSLWSASVAPLIARPSTLRLPLTLSVAPIVSSTGLADASSSTACGAEAAPLGASAASARANETAAVAAGPEPRGSKLDITAGHALRIRAAGGPSRRASRSSASARHRGSRRSSRAAPGHSRALPLSARRPSRGVHAALRPNYCSRGT